MRQATPKEPLTMEQRQLVSDNIVLAQKLATKRANPYVSPEDRLQDAYMGLIDAARKFEPERGLQFSTYAGERIIGAMIDAEREVGSFIHMPRRALERKETSPGVVFAGAAVRGRDSGSGQGEDMELGDVVLVAPEPSVTLDDVDAVETALSYLTERERYIIKRRLCDGATNKRIAAEIGRAESLVSKLVPEIIDLLRSFRALSHYAPARAEV